MSNTVYLHSTLFILKQKFSAVTLVSLNVFTFHSVYIKTKKLKEHRKRQYQFTFHSVYIKTRTVELYYMINTIFTFHSVYIKTSKIYKTFQTIT